MSPYYQDEHCTIYNADCREVLPELGRCDILMTDPPYGMEYKSNRRVDHQQLGGIAGDGEFPQWVFDIEYTSAAFVFCRWDNLPEIPKPKSFIVWDKGTHSMGDLQHEFGRQWEACAFYAGVAHQWRGGRPNDIVKIPRVPPGRLVHPTEKPVQLITKLLNTSCSDIDLQTELDIIPVLDPFMGSGSTLQGAKDLGIKSVGIELEERYCEIAANRLSQGVLDLGV